jgi:hypothetical protein
LNDGNKERKNVNNEASFAYVATVRGRSGRLYETIEFTGGIGSNVYEALEANSFFLINKKKFFF